jgi:anti-repressor protein
LNELQIFNNKEFGQVRTVIVNDKLCFIASDIANALGYTNSSKAISDHCRWVTKCYIPHPQSPGKSLEVNAIPEGDLYRLVSHSELPSAEKFEAWVFDEVLPSVRKNGGYIANQENLSDAEILAKAVLLANNVIAQKDKLIADMKPKAEFFDAVADCKNAQPMDRVAKILDMGIGRNKLFDILRQKKVLDRNNIPYQEYVDRGYFRVVEQKFTKPTGEIQINIKTMVFQRGIDYIRKLVA